MSWHEDALGGGVPRAADKTTGSGSSELTIHTSRASWKSDPGVYGLSLEIAALPAHEILEQYRLIRCLPEQLAYAAFTRRRILWRELMRRWVTVAP